MDYYKGKESLSRVVVHLDIIKIQMVDGIDRMGNLHQMQRLKIMRLL